MHISRAAAVLVSMALLVWSSPAVRADKLDDDLAAAKKMLLEGNDDEAAIKLGDVEDNARVAIVAKPGDAHAAYILGMAAMYVGDDELSERSLEQAVRADPTKAQYVFGRAQLSLFQKKPKEAVGLLQKFVTQDPKNVDAWEMLGDAQTDAEQYPQAQASYEKAVELATAKPKYMVHVAEALVAQKKVEEAIAMYEKALAVDAKYTPALQSMAQLYQRDKKYDKAAEVYGRMAALDPADYRSRANRVQMFEAAGDMPSRDKARQEILDLYKRGGVLVDSFCREQFDSGKSRVMVFEYFEIKPPRAVKYAFNVVGEDGKTVERRIELGSPDDLTAAAVKAGEIKASERIYRLDAYTEKAHEALGTFKQEPPYEEARKQVKEYLSKISAGSK